MSTIDPRVARIQSHDVAFTGAVVGWLAAFLAILHALVWVVAALAAGATLDVVRRLVIDAGETQGAFALLAGWPLVVLALLGFMLGAAVHGAAERVTSEGAASAIRFTTAAIGVTIGLIAFASSWTPPRTMGWRGEYFGSGTTPWGLFEWVAYWAPVWLPMLTGVIAIATSVMAAALVSRRIASQRRTVEVLTSGIHASGHVTEVRSADPDDKGRCRVRFTVSYVDRTGQRRWVERTSTLYKDEIPEVDGPAEVWYDGERLDDTSRMAVDVAVLRGRRDQPKVEDDA